MFVLKELSTDHHLVVCTLKALKPLRKRKTFRPRKTYRIQWESLADKEVRTAFADNITSKFKELAASTEDSETEWCLFRTAVITFATNCKRVGVKKSSEKRTPWWNQEVKEAKVPSPNKAHRKYFKNRSKQCGTNSIISSPSIITCNSYVVRLAFSCLVTMQWDPSCGSPILLLKVFIKSEISLDNW